MAVHCKSNVDHVWFDLLIKYYNRCLVQVIHRHQQLQVHGMVGVLFVAGSPAALDITGFLNSHQSSRLPCQRRWDGLGRESLGRSLEHHIFVFSLHRLMLLASHLLDSTLDYIR